MRGERRKARMAFVSALVSSYGIDLTIVADFVATDTILSYGEWSAKMGDVRVALANISWC